VLPGDDEDVNGRLAIYVFESQHIVLVVNHFSIYLPSHYSTEYAVGLAHGHLL
jgi:hypothetical protein